MQDFFRRRAGHGIRQAATCAPPSPVFGISPAKTHNSIFILARFSPYGRSPEGTIIYEFWWEGDISRPCGPDFPF